MAAKSMKIFIHGLNSSGSGFKGMFFKDRNPEIYTPDFSGPMMYRMQQLENLLGANKPWVVIGSSLGGLMATLYTGKFPERVDRLVLLAPALREAAFKNGVFKRITCPVTIFHGINDEVVPIDEVKSVAPEIFTSLTFNEVDDDHMLHKTIPTVDWESLIP